MQRSDFILTSGLALAGMVLPLPKFTKNLRETMDQQDYKDVIIIGGSYAGLATAMALGRALKNVLIIDGRQPCNRQTPYSHNFLTQDGVPPLMISKAAQEQVLQYPSVRIMEELAVAVTQKDNGFEVQTDQGSTFFGKKLVFATGIRDLLPDIPGLAACWGISVLHCPFCHGYEVRHRVTGILGNGDAGYEMAALLSNWTHDLTVYTHGTSTFSEDQKIKLSAHGIQIDEREIEEIKHNAGQIEQIVFKNGQVTNLPVLYIRPPFEQHCLLPEILGCALTTEGYIHTDSQQQTTVQGVFACGDNTSRMRTVANAVASGTSTGIALSKILASSSF